MPTSTSGPDLTTVNHEEPVQWESPALRDAITGLTGNLGVEVHARQLVAWQAVSYAELSGASTARELEAAATAAEGEGRR